MKPKMHRKAPPLFRQLRLSNPSLKLGKSPGAIWIKWVLLWLGSPLRIAGGLWEVGKMWWEVPLEMKGICRGAQESRFSTKRKGREVLLLRFRKSLFRKQETIPRRNPFGMNQRRKKQAKNKSKRKRIQASIQPDWGSSNRAHWSQAQLHQKKLNWATSKDSFPKSHPDKMKGAGNRKLQGKKRWRLSKTKGLLMSWKSAMGLFFMRSFKGPQKKASCYRSWPQHIGRKSLIISCWVWLGWWWFLSYSLMSFRLLLTSWHSAGR